MNRLTGDARLKCSSPLPLPFRRWHYTMSAVTPITRENYRRRLPSESKIKNEERERIMQRKTIVVSLMAVLVVASISAFGADGDKARVKGMITSRTGETLLVKSADGNVTVVLTDYTKTKDDKGLFGLDKQHMSNVVLIPGLKVDIDGTSDEQGRVVARTITVDGDDLETAEMVQYVWHPTSAQVAVYVQQLEDHRRQL